ncbi:hypothetical protein ZYGR_0AG01650 [Zygosaccharomyces rouxii]|uniref:Serine/threonine-protein kinase Tel1 n=1 Tax=Zygosaccharomyces rouxii TaxID=4956 RepID=A0A1Q3A8W3_ZYGRO|nr:hypothetical protein ZYGR_0AG01650 [Zygosaccharomyces rouxii]
MENLGILNTLRDLESSKVKSRSKALDDLTSILKQSPDLIPTKLLGSTAETLVSQITIEHERYCDLLEKQDSSQSNKFSLQENRFSTLAYVLRLFVEKTCSRFKFKTVNLLLYACQVFISDRSNTPGLLHPISVHFSYTLLALLRCDLFQLKYGSFTWFDITEKICSILEERFKVSTNDRNVSNLLECLSELISLDTIRLRDVSAATYRVLSGYLKLSQKETVNTRLILSLVNQFIVKCHIHHINQCIHLIRATWNHALVIGFAINADIQRELSYCDMFASELMVNNLPLMVGQEVPEDVTSLLQEYLTQRLLNFKPTNLTLDYLQFKEQRKRKVEWFEFFDFQLLESANPHEWFNLLAIIKLMQSYYSIAGTENLAGQLFKRRKIQSGVASFVKDSSNLEDFIYNALEQGDSNVQLLALEMCAFHNANNVGNSSYYEQLKELLLQRFGDVNLTGWTCLSLITLITQKNFFLEEHDVNRIFKVCLPLVKMPKWCQLSCRLLATAMKYFKHHITDPSTLNQIHDLYELSPINGPCVICNEAFGFWQYLEGYGKELRFRHSDSTMTKLLEWLDHKWEQLLPLEHYQDRLYTFVAWLNNRSIQIDDNDANDYSQGSLLYDWKYPSWQKYYNLWIQHKEERSFLLLRNLPVKLPKDKEETTSKAAIAVDRDCFHRLLYRLLDTIDGNCHFTPLLRFKWIVQILKIINCLTGDLSFLSFVEDFQRSVGLFLQSLKFDDKTSFLAFFHEIVSLRMPNVEHLIFNGLDIQGMMVAFRKTLDPVYGGSVSRTNHFDDIVTRGSELDISHTIACGMNQFYRCGLQISVEALLHVLEVQSEPANRRFEALLDFFNGLGTKSFVSCLVPTITFFENCNKEGYLDPSLLEQFTQLVSEHLLNKEYLTSNLSMYWMSSYLDAIRPHWLINSVGSLNSDCNDILDWVISRFEDAAFSGVYAIMRLSQFLLHMLRFHDISRVCVKGGKQRIFATFVDCLKKLDKATVLTQLPEIIEYMSIVSYKNQKIIFLEIKGLFEPPQQSIEYTSFHTLAMLRFASLSYSNLVLALESMILSSRFKHTCMYVTTALEKITKELQLSSLRDLFDLCKFDLFSFWSSQGHNLSEECNDGTNASKWDISLFGFGSLYEFEKAHYSDLAAFLFSRSHENLSLMREIKNVTGRSEEQLLFDGYYKAVPLSYVEQGVQNFIFEIAKGLPNDLTKSCNQLLVYRWVLKYCDFGSLVDTGLMLGKLFPSSKFLANLFPSNAHTSRFQFPLHIPPERWAILLLNFPHGHTFSAGELHFLILWILADLEASRYNEMRLNCIRQIKFVIVSHEKVLSNCLFFSNILKTLARYLEDVKLHEEVLQLIISFITLSDQNDLSIVDAFSSIYAEALTFMKDPQRELNGSFKKLSKFIAGLPVQFSRTWKFCDEIVQGMSPGDDIYQNDELLKTEDCNVDKLVLLSLMFSYAKAPDLCQLKLDPTDLAVCNLLKYEIPDEYISENIKLWTAYYFDSFGSAQETSELLGNSNLAQQNMSFRDLFSEPGSLNFLLAEFFDTLEGSLVQESCQVNFLWESVLTFLLNNYGCGRENSLSITDTFYEKYKKRFVPMDRGFFTLLHGDFRHIQDPEAFIKGDFLSTTISYDKWLLEFAGSLLKDLSLVLPDIVVFYHLCSASRRFTEDVLTILFNLVIFHNPRRGVDWAVRIVSQMEKLLETNGAAGKTGAILKIVSMLRSGHRLNERQCVSAYSSLPLKQVCKSALQTGQVTFSYMLFEEFSMNDMGTLDTVTLGSIYESLGDVDLMAGLPTPHTLAGALYSINKTEQNTWKSFLINNANFNANYSNQLNSGRIPLLRATESLDFYGLASFLGEDDGSQQPRDPYKWALQLGNWNLPLPEFIDTKEKGLYYSLKKVLHEDAQPFKSLEGSLVKLVERRRDFNNQAEWVDTISNVSLLQRVTRSLETGDDIVLTLKTLLDKDEEKLQKLDFEYYKPCLQSKHLLSSIISDGLWKAHRDRSLDIKVVTAVQLANDVKYSIENKSTQDALRYAFLIENLLKSVRDLDNSSPILSSLERLGSFVSAEALWECKEFKTPVRILEGLLHHQGGPVSNGESSEMNSLLEVPDDYIQAMLVKWTSESRLETASAIFEKYIRNFEAKVKDHGMRAKMFYILGNFLNDQAQRLQASREIEERQRRCDRQVNESNALEMIYKNSNLSENERKDAKRHYVKVRMQLENDLELLNNLKSQRMQFVSKALHYYLNTLVFTNKFDDDVLDKFCGLWFEYDGVDDVNSLLLKEIGSVPSWKFLPWVNQIASKLSTEQTKFQRPLQLTMKRLLFKLPYDSLYSVMSILFYDKQSANLDQRILQKVRAVENLLKELQGFEKGNYYKNYVIPVKDFCEMSVELANTRVELNSKFSRALNLSNLKIGQYWLKMLPEQRLPLPTMHFPIRSSSDGKMTRPYIASTVDTVEISSTGISLPKIVTFQISDGLKRKVLIKGSNDDLRQDAIMEQVFGQVNKILQKDKQMRKLDLNISTYEVIPLGPNAGIIEYVAHSVSLNQILVVLHRNDHISFDQARKKMKAVQNKSKDERIRTYNKLTEIIKPQLRNFFFDYFSEPQEWLDVKKTYTKGIAASSIVGHILGLGDRHLNNILVDYSTGKPIHIDLGVAFDQGRLLPIPELVPFRLTRDVVDGFGITGVDGLFRRSCESTYSVLRENYEKVMYVLNILKWDPLYSWVMSPVRRHRHLLEEDSQSFGSVKLDEGDSASELEENQESYRALKSVEEKLIGNGLSVEATIQELIQQATDVENLALIYMGWSPFY